MLRQKIICKLDDTIFFNEHLPKYEDHGGQLKIINIIMNSLKVMR